eukprot:gnl/Chilomastix_caulleri/7228.p2 GENE.gnl/Chilomastix_caulleri/7228~~gnl/Chilomastix_caulleri/7228.p2  ORF type:complete len:59 (+),score=4.30 gnl/Chilomastix_caulleri/7228:140-316(+)
MGKGKVKRILSSIVVLIIAIVLFAILAITSVFNFISLAKCGSTCSRESFKIRIGQWGI